MSISVECQCGRAYRLPANAAGKRFRCKECGKAVVIQSESPPVSEGIAEPAEGGRLAALFDDEPDPALPEVTPPVSRPRRIVDESVDEPKKSRKPRRRKRRTIEDVPSSNASSSGPSVAMLFISIIVGGVMLSAPEISIVVRFVPLCIGVIVANVGFVRMLVALSRRESAGGPIALTAAGFILALAPVARFVLDLLNKDGPPWRIN